MTLTPLTHDDLECHLNEELLRQAEALLGEISTFQGRLDKLESTRTKASTTVFKKVQSDYRAKISEAQEKLSPVRTSLLEDEARLTEKKSHIEEAAQHHRETIEESSLRMSLGEYDADAHQKIADKEQKEVDRLENALKVFDEGLNRIRQVLTVGHEPVAPAPVVIPPPKVEREATLAPARASQAHTFEGTAKIALEPSLINPRLEVSEGGKIHKYPIDKTIHLGRSPSNDVVLKEAKVSRNHAEIQIVPDHQGRYVLIDLESSNGTWVGGKKIKEHTLESGDEIVIGNTKMTFRT